MVILFVSTFYPISPTSLPVYPRGHSCTHSGQASCIHDNVLYIFHAMYTVLVLKAQGRSQTSEQDEASFQRRRCEPLEGSGGIHNALLSIYRSGIFSSEKSVLSVCRSSVVCF